MVCCFEKTMVCCLLPSPLNFFSSRKPAAGDTMMSVGDIMSTAGVFSTLGDTMSTLGDTMISVGDVLSTPGDVQCTGVSIQIQLFSQWPSPTFIMISPWCTHDIPQCTEHPPVYSSYPLTVFMIPPWCAELHTPRCTAQTSCRVVFLVKRDMICWLIWLQNRAVLPQTRTPCTVCSFFHQDNRDFTIMRVDCSKSRSSLPIIIMTNLLPWW